MKKKLIKLITVLMAAVLLMPILCTGTALNMKASADNETASAADIREEVVYANLSSNGETKEIYVVNILRFEQAGLVSDYGSYNDVKNLTSTETIAQNGDQITVNAPAGNFYYQGTLISTDLPWVISIKYYLDGVELPANELAGKTGHIEIKLGTTPNAAIDSSYFDNYLLQISMTLDASRCSNITAHGGTIANAGKNKLATFAVMPGKNGAADLTADVTNFSMAGIDLAAVPLSMKIDPPDTSDMTTDLETLSDAVAALNDGIATLRDGTSELKNGAADLKIGSSSFAGGLNDLNSSSTDLVGGSTAIKDALSSISSSMNSSSTNDSSDGLNLNDLSQLPDGLSQLAAGLDRVSSGLADLKAGFSDAYARLDSAVLEIPDSTVSQEEIAKLYQDNPDKKDTIDKLVGFYSSASQAKGTYLAVKPAFDAVGSSALQLSGAIGGISETLKSMSAQIKGALEGNDALAQMAQLSAGLSELSSSYSAFHEGLVQYTAGVWMLNDNYGGLQAGISGISGGVDELYGGILKTYDGTTMLNNEVKNMPSLVDEEINKLLNEYDKSDFKPVSFVSAKNDNTASVQFILKTEKIEKAVTSDAPPEQPQASNLWTRFLDLFK